MAALTGPTVVRDRVGEQLARLPGAITTRQDGAFLVSRGTQVAAVQVIGVQPDVTLVLVYAVVATEVPLVDEACRFLATRDLGLPLVHFELVDGGNLIAAHALLGEFLSGPHLVAAIDAVSAAAEILGPQVRSRFGGDAIANLVPPVDRTTSDWLTRSVQPVSSGVRVPGRTSRAVAVAVWALLILLVTAAFTLWGAGSGVAVALVLGPLAVAMAARMRRSGRNT